MARPVYISGSLVRVSLQFTDVAGAAADPTTVVLKYRKGAGATTTVTYPAAPLVKDAVGAYHADLDTTGWAGPGNQVWITEGIGTGAVTAIQPDSFEVEPPAL